MLKSIKATEPTVGIGWSLGGMVLLGAAQKRPDSFKGLVLIGTTPCFVQREGYDFAQKRSRLRLLRNSILKGRTPALEKFYKANFTNEELETENVTRFIQGLTERNKTYTIENLLSGLRVLEEADLRETISGIITPTLLIHGSRDEVCLSGGAEFIHQRIKGSALKVLEGAGHAPFVTRCSETAVLINDFVKGL